MNKYIKYTLLLLSIVCYYFLITYFTVQLNIFFDNCNIILLILFVFLLYSIDKKQVNNMFLIYVLHMIVILYFRKTIEYESYFSFDFYLFKWLKLIFVHKIVFLNIISNLVLFIPLPLFLKRYYKSSLYVVFFGLFIIVFCELLQVVTKRGVFDIVDIVLNFTGMSISMFFYILIKGKENKKAKASDKN